MTRSVERLLPANLPPAQVAYRIGLVSDTHAPYRLAELPPTLFQALEGVDLILHAGDVGELWVLDQLSTLAPVVAVHGNDDGQDATEILPYTQIVTCHEKRILLWHSHYPDWPVELESRRDDALAPKFSRIAAQGAKFDAQIIIFGHWHIPLVNQQDATLLINPGALASGNEITRQLHQTAAVLFLDQTGAPYPVHFDLNNPHQPFDPRLEVQRGFQAAAERFTASVLSRDLKRAAFAMRDSFSRDDVLLLRETILPLAHRVWQGAAPEIGFDEFTAAVAADIHLPEAFRQRVLTILKSYRTE